MGLRGRRCMTSEYEIAVTQLFKTETQRDVIEWGLAEAESDRWYKVRDIADAVGKSKAMMNKLVQQNEGDIGPLLRFGILEPKHIIGNMPNIPHYRIADSPVMDLLAEHTNDLELTELFGTTGAQRLVGFFLMDAGDRQLSKNKIRHEMGGGFETVANNIDRLVDSGLIVEVEGARGTEYTLDTDSDVYAVLGQLNNAVLDVANSRSATATNKSA